MTDRLPPATEPPPTPPLSDGTPARPGCPIQAVFGPDDRYDCSLSRGHAGDHAFGPMPVTGPDPATAPCGAHPISEDCCCLCHEAGRADERRRIRKLAIKHHATYTKSRGPGVPGLAHWPFADLLGDDGG